MCHSRAVGAMIGLRPAAPAGIALIAPSM
jgi:hypothetical protein